MRTRPAPLLCELHAHSTWSDGVLRCSELVDLYGVAGLRRALRHRPHLPLRRSVAARGERRAARRPRRQLRRLPRRGRDRGGPGARALRPAAAARPRADLERPRSASRGTRARARAPHVRLGVDDGLEAALTQAREAGAAIVAAHPFAEEADRSAGSHHPALRTRPRAARAARRPLRALQPHASVLVGRGGPAAVRRLRRLPPAGAPRRLEDPRSVREGRADAGRIPPLGAAGLPHAARHDERVAA